jgi:hypothetical protein
MRYARIPLFGEYLSSPATSLCVSTNHSRERHYSRVVASAARNASAVPRRLSFSGVSAAQPLARGTLRGRPFGSIQFSKIVCRGLPDYIRSAIRIAASQ